jgi:hypothetical protein
MPSCHFIWLNKKTQIYNAFENSCLLDSSMCSRDLLFHLNIFFFIYLFIYFRFLSFFLNVDSYSFCICHVHRGSFAHIKYIYTFLYKHLLILSLFTIFMLLRAYDQHNSLMHAKNLICPQFPFILKGLTAILIVHISFIYV